MKSETRKWPSAFIIALRCSNQSESRAGYVSDRETAGGWRLRAYRHRLIFWPIFSGAVVFSVSSKGTGPLSWPIVYALVAAVVVCAALYASDPMRSRSGWIRRGLLAAGLIAGMLCIIGGGAANCGITIFFFLVLFAVPITRAERRARRTAAAD